MQPVFMNSEQQAIIEEIGALDRSFGADATLCHSLSAVANAKALRAKAIAAGLDQRIFYQLTRWISLHETEQSLPEHLRSWHPRP